MFRPRASFGFVARRHIFYLFLVFAFHGKASGEYGTVVVNEFGCDFYDYQYNMLRADEKQPVWSNRTTNSRYKVDDFENINEDPFKQLFSEVNIMNTLSLFTQLVRTYSNSKSSYKSFESFYNNYQVPFQHQKEYYDVYDEKIRKTQDPVSYLIQELHTLQESLNKQKGGDQKWIRQKAGKKRENAPLNTPYLVSAYVDPIQVDFSRYYLHQIAPDVSQNLEKLHGKHVQDHLAGIIPIYIGNRTGYILIDPGYANGHQQMFLPFVAYVMNDEKTPHGDYIRGTESLRNPPQFVVQDDVNGNPFILARHENPGSSTKTHVIYSIGKPYCSFMRNTLKPMLVRPYHEIIKHVHGILIGYLDFKITPESKKFNETIFTLTWDNEIPTEEFKTNIKNSFFMNSSTSEEVVVIINQFKLIQSRLFNDRYFVADLTGFAKKLGSDPEPENKSAVVEHIPQVSIREKTNKLLKKIIPCSREKTING